MNRRRVIAKGEALALYPKAIHGEGPKAFFDLWAAPMPANERIGEMAVVHVRGPLEHHEDACCDSYDAIRARVAAALTGECDEEEDEGPPASVVLRFDSPGGVVSGLTECVLELRRMSARAGIPLIAFVDEMAASAAYALVSACEEVYLPPSAIAGSIGVISTMVDQTAFDERLGLRFVTLTSGQRKADGHPHVAISEEAQAAEQHRVDQLAGQFYRLVRTARGLSTKEIRGQEAGIFVGQDAVEAGLADALMSWDELAGVLAQRDPLAPLAHGVSTSTQRSPTPRSDGMKTKLEALLAKKRAALKAEKDKKKRAALKAEIAQVEGTMALLARDAKVTHTIEHKEKHVADDGDEDDVDDGSEEGDDDDEEDDEEEAGGNETDRSDEEEDDEEEASKGESEEEAAGGDFLRAAVASLPKAQRTKALAKLAAMSGKAKMFDQHGARLAKLEAEAKADKTKSAISAALSARRITPGEAKTLAKKSPSFVAEFLSMRPKAIVHGSSDDAARPAAATPEAAAAGCTDEELKMFAAASAASGISVEKLVANYRAEMTKLNGAGAVGSY